MAEAVVEERASLPARYYCHMCNVEINIPNPDYTCPICAGGFVEELPENATPEGGTNNDSTGSATSLGANSDSSSTGDLHAHHLPMNISDLELLRHDIASLLSSRNVPNLEITIAPGSRRANVVALGSSSGSHGSSSSGNGSGSVAGGRVRPQHLDRLDNVLVDFLQSLPIAGGNAGDYGGNSHMFFMGNPGDYAWGREGLDTIVTQMLNQMETSGPPPLSKQKIDEIAKVTISSDDVDRKLQCSVCWEDFKIDELVRKLPCSHIYHENCIVPWLNLHGTCPICRKSLTDDDSDDSILMDDAVHPAANGQQPPCPVHGHNRSRRSSHANVAGGGGGNRNNSARNSSSQTQPGASTSARNNVFTFDDDNMNLD